MNEYPFSPSSPPRRPSQCQTPRALFLPESCGLPLGLIVIFAAVIVKLFAVREMVRVKTNLNIRKPANDIATSSLYSVSRNPLYFDMILLNIGFSGESGNHIPAASCKAGVTLR